MDKKNQPSATPTLSLQDFTYTFPDELVAQEACAERDRARLLIRQVDGQFRHAHIADLITELPRDSLLILNDTRVFPSRLRGRLATGAQIELFLLEPTPSGAWLALGKPLKKLKIGTIVAFPAGVHAEVTAKTEDEAGNAFVEVKLSRQGAELAAWLDEHGYIPLPPYIKRPQASPASESADRRRYQTVYARESGSVAAPTAGLHFTTQLLAALRARGTSVHYVSLHVGAGTFLPVKTATVAAHQMHTERYCVSKETATALVAARAESRKVVAVGTTSLRSLEDHYRHCAMRLSPQGSLADAIVAEAGVWRSTGLFIYPQTASDSYKPWVIDGLLTNFHQPGSTLFMLVSALLTLPATKALYAAAIAERYQLFSYGDACLLWL